MKNERIVVSSTTGETETFKSAKQLAERARALYAGLGGVVEDMPGRIYERYAELCEPSGDEIDRGIREIARKRQLHEPSRPPHLEAPHDGKRVEADQLRDAAIAVTQEKLAVRFERERAVREEEARVFARATRDGKPPETAKLERLRAAAKAAEDDYLVAADAERRARARSTALALAADRWRALAAYRRDQQAKQR